MRNSKQPLKPLLSVDGDPVFDEPWQAQALALADTLVKQGMFSATSWSETLGKMLQKAQDSKQADNAMTYYKAVLAALEELVAGNSQVKHEDMQNMRKDWEAAYLSTPHGQPVELK